MTVGELIAELTRYPPSMEVAMYYDGTPVEGTDNDNNYVYLLLPGDDR